MASLDQVIQQIKFALENLSERNGQHDFEHLCRHFARHRICFNILPATGPVGMGGDQGRDFETFSTFISNLGSDKFAVVAESKRMVFACSLQKENLAGKVRGDVASIMSGTLRPSIIYFFSSRSIPVSTRHELQKWAHEIHSVQLDILDREALAEQLSDAGVFWIATRHLNVPLEIFPQPPQTNEEYELKKADWTRSTATPNRYSDFIELKRYARHALSNLPQDVTFWLGLLEKFETFRSDDLLWVQAAYEIIVLNARLTRSLRGQEDRIRRYFSEAEKFQYADEVENAVTIMSYVVAAHRMNEIGIDPNEIQKNWIGFRDKIEHGIGKPASQNQLCLWLAVRGHLSFAGGVMKETSPNFAETLSLWLRVAEECADAPTFPVQAFHDRLFDYMGLIGEQPKFDAILEKLRPEIAKRTGDAALAESHFKRAKQFFDQKQFVRAIRELHTARVKWFSDETLDQSTFCSILLARCYSRLGLNYAAIDYALAAGFIVANAARPSLADNLFDCLSTAAEAAYDQGHWFLFSGLVESLLILHHERASNPDDLTEHEHLQWLFKNLPVALLVTERLIPSHVDEFKKNVRRWGFENLIEEGIPIIRPPFDKWSDEKLLEVLHKSFTGPPFSDAGEKCEATWSALGIEWRIRWINTYEAFKVAGECVTFLQVAIAEFAGSDLDVVPGKLCAEIELTDKPKITIKSSPDNNTYQWCFCVPRMPIIGVAGVNDFAEQMLICVVELVRAFSVMPSDKFRGLIIEERGFKVYSQAFFVRRFPELISFFLPDAGFHSAFRLAIKCPIQLEKWKSKTPSELEWVNSIHPTFDEAAELKRIQIRYDVTMRGLKFTLKRLEGDLRFQSVIQNLRAKDWKDWHILQAMLNAAANYRTARKLGSFTGQIEWMKAFKEESFSNEQADSPMVPVENFSELELDFATLTIFPSILVHSGLEMHQKTPNVEGLREYLRHRWRYWDLDVKHPNIFKDV